MARVATVARCSARLLRLANRASARCRCFLASSASAAHIREEDAIPELAEGLIDEAMTGDVEVGAPACNFEVGDNVFYPQHGAGVVVKKETKHLLGENRDYLTIQILRNRMTAMVPCENAHTAGPRRVIDGEQVEKVIGVLTGEVSEIPKSWTHRFKHNREKIKNRGRLRARRGRPQPDESRVGRRASPPEEADVHPRQEEPRVKTHVRARQGRGRRRVLPRRAATGALRRQADDLSSETGWRPGARAAPRPARDPLLGALRRCLSGWAVAVRSG